MKTKKCFTEKIKMPVFFPQNYQLEFEICLLKVSNILTSGYYKRNAQLKA